MSETEVRRFDAESWVCVHCRPNSDVVQMTSNIADEAVAKMIADSIKDFGGHVFRICKAGELVAALYLICDPNHKPPIADDPEFDATDAAHPAWWRGHDHTAKVFCQHVNAILDRKDFVSGICAEPWESTRRRLASVAAKEAENAELRTEANEMRKLAQLGTHRVIACGVAATHPDASLTDRGAYADEWHTQQLDQVKALRRDRDGLQQQLAALRARVEEVGE